MVACSHQSRSRRPGPTLVRSAAAPLAPLCEARVDGPVTVTQRATASAPGRKLAASRGATEHAPPATRSPFTDLTPRGPDQLFAPQELEALLRTIEAVRATAAAC